MELITDIIAEFKDGYAFLSNFYPNGNVERQFQAEKFLDPEIKREIIVARTPGKAKRLANQYKAMGKQRANWHEVNLDIMLNLLRKKFSNPVMREKLLATGDKYLQEGNLWHDTFWGVDLRTGKGKNMLGRLLMLVREEIRKEIL